ncbi:helix-turn-helix domain-containing protein [Streptomyces sp. SCSIO 30461]|uniref:helix-turn-helix domain-containing protein n=1 Tax=Streptomyces sp. SCSIO 30461 TaxID=3118085 RepID=UPI0030CF5EEE
MTREDSQTGSEVLRILELLAREAPAHAYEQLVAQACRSGAARHRIDQLTQAKGLALEVNSLFDRRRQREAELAALVDTALDLTEPRRLDATLRLITRRARLLLNTDLACTALADEATGDLTVGVADGAVSARTTGHRIPAAALPGGPPGELPGPFWTADHLSGEPSGHTSALEDLLQAESLHAVLGVPLRAGDRCLGFLYVADRGIRHFTPDEVALMCSLADLSAVAIRTARLLETVQAANTALEEAGTRARAGLSDALRAKDLQDDLVRLVLDGIGMDELLARAAAELGGSLSVWGQGGERLGGHGRTPRPDSAELERVRLNAAATGITCALTGGTLVVPLSVRSEDVGSLLFHPDETAGTGTDPEPSEQVLLSYARTVSLLLVMQRSTEAGGQADDDLLEDLVTWDGPAEGLARRTRRLAARLERPHVVVVARPQTEARDLVESWAAGHARRHRGMKTLQGDRLTLLLPGDDPATCAALVREQLAEATGVLVTAGAAPVTQGADAIRRAHQEAVRCLDALIALGGAGRSAAARDLGFIGMLLADDHDASGFVERALGPLIDHDAERFSNLVETLDGWFSASGSPTRAAELLYVHPNTVSRRLERITQLLGPDWQQPERSLDLQLALRLQRARIFHDPSPDGLRSGESEPPGRDRSVPPGPTGVPRAPVTRASRADASRGTSAPRSPEPLQAGSCP